MDASQRERADERSFVLITAAYNEEANIAGTIDSVVAQERLPLAWAIVSDGSTDRTDAIVAERAARHPFIRFVRQEKDARHCFGSKVRALHRAEAELAGLSSRFIGVLDADVTFEPDYFERLLDVFGREPDLGVGGGNVVQWVDGRAEKRIKDFGSVAGAVQFFRRECYEQTGGFLPIEAGGEDALIETTARMHGWRVRTIPELEVKHHGMVGAGAGGRLRARFKWGEMNFLIGYHPLYQLARSVYRSVEAPVLFGSLAEIAGFTAARLRKGRPQAPADVVRFLQAEQLAKLRRGGRRAGPR